MPSRSRKGAWIEISIERHRSRQPAVAPARERGLKLMTACLGTLLAVVAPARERGLKLPFRQIITLVKVVAPARERGLKFHPFNRRFKNFCRSRKGAWIEIIEPK